MDAPNKVSRLQLFLSLPIDCLAALMGGTICLSLSPIFIRLSEYEIGPNAAIFNRLWIATVAFGLVSRFLAVRHRERKKETQKEIQSDQQKPHLLHRAKLLMIADGVILSMGLTFWAWSLTQTSIANASMMHNLVPIFTVLGGWLALSQTFDHRFLLGMFVALAGSALLEMNDLLSLRVSQQLLGDLAALLSAVFFGIHPLIVEQLRAHINPITIMTWSSATSSLLLLPFALIVEEQLFPSSFTGWFSVIAQAVVAQMLGIGLLAYSLKRLSAGLTSLVALFIPVLSAVEGWAIFSENLSLLTSVSFFVILLGMYLAISSRSAIKPKVEPSY
ncbi:MULTISPECIES: DMT family transporter [Okeania]|uniref:DMT family transporter n=1 Tax=Okeania TaxID=1458928 RepID=UPI000F535B00|nr:MULTISPECIES: DMT family transporter [Okeania]NET12361.1 DMT family transporter [Okeania sp. SIO1H6]NES75825.1 DMT family transporter [Okeania sp. SIO1H4]NET20008.1 DMT family transporter [Okeania sp. SIO1H5]NET75518.1 DMT family transporter [Okeania sp. SIO1F9]NET91842.1 DMT family transporter [Okeania sp. SIO1H2]